MKDRYEGKNYGFAVLKMIMCFEVVLSHFWSDAEYVSALTPFMLLRECAVPVFMIISFVLGEKVYNNLSTSCIKKRVWRLFFPQLTMAILYWGVYNILYMCLGIGTLHNLNSLIWQVITGHSEHLNPSMWYTTVLIILTILFFAIWYLCKEKAGIIIFSLLLTLSMILQYTGINFRLFDNFRYELKYPLGRIVEMVPYAVIGFMIAHYKLYDFLRRSRYIGICVMILLGIFWGGMERDIFYPKGFGYAGIPLIIKAMLIITLAYTVPFEKLSIGIKKVSIPAHFEPPVRTLRATIPTNESQYSRAWKLLFRTWETMIPARWKSL